MSHTNLEHYGPWALIAGGSEGIGVSFQAGHAMDPADVARGGSI